MALTAGTVEIDVRGDLTPLRRDLGQVNSIAAGVGAQTGKQFATGLATQKSRIAGVAGTLRSAFLLAGGVAVARGIKSFTFDAALEARGIMEQTEAVIKSTGGAANVTAQDIDALSTRLSKLSAVDDELVQESNNVLLTFKNIRNEVGEGNDIYDQAAVAALDLSTALKKDLRSSALQVGKAINDPVLGVSALGRAGVQFSQDQKDMIKSLVETGDVAGAQKIVLGELQSQVGGSAEAAGKVQPYKRLAVALENVGEAAGKKALPALDRMAEAAINVLEGTSAPQDSLNAFFDSFSANDRAVDDTSSLIGAFGRQLQAGVISLDTYKEKVRDQIGQTKALADQYPDNINLQDELNFQVAAAEAAVRRYNAALAANAQNFQSADAAASNYLNTVGAAPSVAFADAQAGGIPTSEGGRRRDGGRSGGTRTPLSSEVIQINVDVNGSRLTRAVNSTSRRTKILLGEV